jgi:hypothetical protein
MSGDTFIKTLEIKNQIVERIFGNGYNIAFSVGRYDESQDVIIYKMKTALRLMKLAHEFEPNNPHIMMQIVWQYEFMYSEPELMLKVIESTLKSYSESKVTQEYRYSDDDVNLLLYARTDYLKEMYNPSQKRKYVFIGEESDRWYE